MAQLINGKVKKNDGSIINPKQGEWYDGQQFWDGTLSSAGQINSKSNQPGAGQMVSSEVNRQASVAQGLAPNANQDYINAQRAKQGQPSTPTFTGDPMAGGDGSYTPGGGAGVGFNDVVQPSLNLPDLYKNLYDNSGISALQDELSAKEKEFIETKAKIGDNPFLSEATRVGRVAKLKQLYNERTANLRNDVATKKADIETKLNLETKQFDINSANAKDALSRFNTLLTMGALNNASGEDIANITRSTGISSEMIRSAIGKANQKDVKTQVITSTNDAGVVTASVINTETGEIIKKTSLGAVGNAQNGKDTSNDKGVQASQAQSAILDYTRDKNAQASLSPEEYVIELMRLYPYAGLTVKSAQEIRDITGQ